MDYNKQAYDFWTTNEKVAHIIPPKSLVKYNTEYPEGQDIEDAIKTIVGDSDVVEVGCGFGRVMGKLSPDQYRGVDINPSAIEMAKERHPDHQFDTYTIGEQLTPSEWVMFYTVLLHISDEDLPSFLETTTANCNQVFLAEIMEEGKRNRMPPRTGKPPAFNRTKDEYVDAMKGFTLMRTEKKDWFDIPNHFTILIFERNNK